VPAPICRVGDSELLALFLPGAWVRVGRNRLWALRHDFARDLQESLCTVLTRGRSGCVRAPEADLGGPA
jgi:hypothetical protein